MSSKGAWKRLLVAIAVALFCTVAGCDDDPCGSELGDCEDECQNKGGSTERQVCMEACWAEYKVCQSTNVGPGPY